MVRKEGFEPPTPAFQMQCANQTALFPDKAHQIARGVAIVSALVGVSGIEPLRTVYQTDMQTTTSHT